MLWIDVFARLNSYFHETLIISDTKSRALNYTFVTGPLPNFLICSVLARLLLQCRIISEIVNVLETTPTEVTNNS